MKINRKRKRKLTTFGKIFFALIFVLLLTAAYFIYDFYMSVKNGGTFVNQKQIKDSIEVVIDEGSSVRTIARLLKKTGVIDNSLAFELRCVNDGIGSTFHSGKFEFTNAMSFEDIAQTLQNPNTDTEHITFLVNEGMSQNDIAEKLEAENIVSAEDFNNVCSTAKLDYDFLEGINRDNRLEGYLFPDTYYFDLDATSEDIITKMLDRFAEIYDNELLEATEELNMTVDEVITVASLIETEIRYPTEREIAASVIYNRLQNGMKLQLDSTVLYALGDKKDRVVEEDTKIESDYNTYYVTGLPTGPICNPGLDCIKAALYPSQTDYLYYVLQDTQTGQHFFTSDYQEFITAKQKYINNNFSG